MEQQASGIQDRRDRRTAVAVRPAAAAGRPCHAPVRPGAAWLPRFDFTAAPPVAVALVEQAVLDTAERLSGPALLLGPGLRVIAMSPLMETLVGTEKCLTVREDRLAASTAAGTAALMRAYAAICASRRPDIPLTLPAARGASALHGAVTQLPAAAMRARSAARALLVVHAPLPLSDVALADSFGLTPAESDVARMLVEGLDIGAIAARRGSAVNTVRNQVKTLLAKTESSRQAELVLKLRRY